MDKSFWIFRNPKQAIFFIMALLMVIGGINVFSASYVMAKDAYANSYHFLIRYVIFGCAGLGAIGVVRKIGYKRLLKPDMLFWIYFGVALLLMAVFLFASVNGAHRWIRLGGLSIQPSEAAKLAVIMVCSSSLGTMMRKGERVSLWAGRSAKLVAMTLAYFVMIYVEPDLGTGAIVVGLMLGLFIIAGLSQREIVGMSIVLAVGAAALTVGTAYRWERMKVFLDPWIDPLDKGYQMVQAQMAIGSGGLVGTNWGHGLSKFFYLPEAHTDFAFAIFAQENGFFGVTAILVLFILLGYVFTYITMRVRDQEGFLLCAGVTFLIVGQSVANIAMVGGLLPVIGVPLVFISYGGSSMVVSMAAIGLLLSVYDETVRIEKEEELQQLAPETRREDFQFTSRRRWR